MWSTFWTVVDIANRLATAIGGAPAANRVLLGPQRRNGRWPMAEHPVTGRQSRERGRPKQEPGASLWQSPSNGGRHDAPHPLKLLFDLIHTA